MIALLYSTRFVVVDSKHVLALIFRSVALEVVMNSFNSVHISQHGGICLV